MDEEEKGRKKLEMAILKIRQDVDFLHWRVLKIESVDVR